MQIAFFKYHGTGNDFILIDNREGHITLSREQVAAMCHRRYGIGADGLMLLEHAAGYDFRMVYYNSDGGESTMCGNGGRCIVAFAHRLGIISNQAHFIAVDGPHTAAIHEDRTISLHMKNVTDIVTADGHSILNTGSPHYVAWVDDVQHFPVFEEGRRIRNLERFAPGGTNVNFAQIVDGALWVRTYERGVEDETLSCGTGVTATAIAATGAGTGAYITTVHTPGGVLQVSFDKSSATSAKDVVLKGPAVFVFEGIWAL